MLSSCDFFHSFRKRQQESPNAVEEWKRRSKRHHNIAQATVKKKATVRRYTFLVVIPANVASFNSIPVHTIDCRLSVGFCVRSLTNRCSSMFNSNHFECVRRFFNIFFLFSSAQFVLHLRERRQNSLFSFRSVCNTFCYCSQRYWRRFIRFAAAHLFVYKFRASTQRQEIARSFSQCEIARSLSRCSLISVVTEWIEWILVSLFLHSYRHMCGLCDVATRSSFFLAVLQWIGVRRTTKWYWIDLIILCKNALPLTTRNNLS